MSKITTRQLKPDDVNDFKAIRLSALKNSPEMFGSTYAVEATRPLHVFAEVISKYVVFAAYSQQQIIGMLILDLKNHLTIQPQAQLYGFFVEPAFRSQGIATQLLQVAIQYGQHLVAQIMLSVRANNTPAIHLYQKFGFQIAHRDMNIINKTQEDQDEIRMVYIYSPIAQ